MDLDVKHPVGIQDFVSLGSLRFLYGDKGIFAGVPFDLSKGDKENNFQDSFNFLYKPIGPGLRTERHASMGGNYLLLSAQSCSHVWQSLS